jgi:hypothetical protein
MRRVKRRMSDRAGKNLLQNLSAKIEEWSGLTFEEGFNEVLETNGEVQ